MLVKDRIAYERKKKGLTTGQLGEMVGINQATISKYETGNIKVIPSDVLRKIIQSLDCNFDSFVEEDPKYCSLSVERVKLENISEEDKSLIVWFHSLPIDIQRIVRQLWDIPITTP